MKIMAKKVCRDKKNRQKTTNLFKSLSFDKKFAQTHISNDETVGVKLR